MSARWWTFGVWAAVAASALYWGISLFVVAPHLPRPAPMAQRVSDATPADFSRLLGAVAPTPPSDVRAPGDDARFHLFGVIRPGSVQSAREGIALIAIDGRTPKVFRVGAVVAGDQVLQAVTARGVSLGPRDGAARVVLSLTAPSSPVDGAPPVSGDTAHGQSASPQSPATVQLGTASIEQQLFHQRQQIQFQQEQMQNQAPIP